MIWTVVVMLEVVFIDNFVHSGLIPIAQVSNLSTIRPVVAEIFLFSCFEVVLCWRSSSVGGRLHLIQYSHTHIHIISLWIWPHFYLILVRFHKVCNVYYDVLMIYKMLLWAKFFYFRNGKSDHLGNTGSQKFRKIKEDLIRIPNDFCRKVCKQMS